MAVRKGLGRGLDLLIPKDEGMPKKSIEKNKENKEPKENQVLTLSIHDVEPNRNQPRKQFDEDAIEELADSIKQYGVIQPLIVQKKDKYYEIIAGERRWRACKKAGLKEVPVIIKNYDEKETLKISLIENLHYNHSILYPQRILLNQDLRSCLLKFHKSFFHQHKYHSAI